jgi:protein-tyrosine phosphatase
MAYRYDGDGFVKHTITHSIENGKNIIRVGIHDTPSEPLDIILPQLIPMLEIYIQEHPTHRILIHCQVGMSRSASVAIALLARFYSISFDEAFALVKQKRSIVQPNQGFMKMLQNFIN